MPSRVDSLKQVVESILPQCEKLGVYLNEYRSVPEFLNDPRIVIARSQDHGDQKDNGKFFFVEQSDFKYYATIDDDINYPKDYVSRLLRQLKFVGDSDAVGVHGFLLPEEVSSITSNRHVFHFGEAAAFLTPASVLGTGTTIFNREKWNLKFSEFGQPGMADVWFAIAAKKRAANLWAIPRPKSWMSAIAQPTSFENESSASLYDAFKGRDLYQVELLREADIRGSWLGYLNQLFSVRIGRENFCFTQGMQISHMAARLKWSSPTARSLEPISKLIQKNKLSLLEGDKNALKSRISSRWLQIYSKTAVEFAVGQVPEPESLEFVEQLPFLVDGLPDSVLPNCLKWDARPDRQEQLQEFISTRYVSSASSVQTVRRITAGNRLLSQLSFEQLIELAAAGERSDFMSHPEFLKVTKTKPDSALDLCYRYLNALPNLKAQDLPSLAEWQALFAGSSDLEKVLIAYAYLQSRAGNQDLPSQILRELNSQSKFDMETYFLGLRLRTLKNKDSQELQEKLATLSEICGFRSRVNTLRKSPKVSVVVTNFNQADSIKLTVENVLASDYPNLEVIVVDDKSTDDSRSILENLQSSNVRVIFQEENSGPYVSRNAALSIAKGEYIAFHDCGDYSLPERISIQVEHLLAHPELQAVRTNHLRLDDSGALGLENNLQFEGDAPVTMLVRKSVFKAIGRFLPTRTRGDIEFLRRVTAFYGADKLAVVAFPFYLAGPPKNSVKFSPVKVRTFTRAASKWHTEVGSNPSLLDPWLIDGLVPFDIPEELKAFGR